MNYKSGKILLLATTEKMLKNTPTIFFSFQFPNPLFDNCWQRSCAHVFSIVNWCTVVLTHSNILIQKLWLIYFHLNLFQMASDKVWIDIGCNFRQFAGTRPWIESGSKLGNNRQVIVAVKLKLGLCGFSIGCASGDQWYWLHQSEYKFDGDSASYLPSMSNPPILTAWNETRTSGARPGWCLATLAMKPTCWFLALDLSHALVKELAVIRKEGKWWLIRPIPSRKLQLNMTIITSLNVCYHCRFNPTWRLYSSRCQHHASTSRQGYAWQNSWGCQKYFDTTS